MNDAPGSKNFFEEIKIPGIEGIIVTTSPGRVYIQNPGWTGNYILVCY